MIYNPLEEYRNKLKDIHLQYTTEFLEDLVQKSSVDIEANRKTVKEYNECLQSSAKLNKKLRWRKFWRVLLCILIVTIPLVIWKLNPIIKALKEEIATVDQKAAELLELAKQQMAPLNNFFTDRDALHLIEKTIPDLDFDTCFSVKQEEDMRKNYDFAVEGSLEESTLDTLAGRYHGNPFLMERKKIHTMGMETYHGYKTISWTESYVGSDGKRHTRTRTETLHATVNKPKPFYSTQVVLNYGAQGAPDLNFSRDASHINQKSDKQIERMVKRGERQLKRKTDRALANNQDFMNMSNTDFEVLFDALDRDHEVQFRTLFTPLAQTNMVELLLADDTYGDDFHFIKRKRMNEIITTHSQGRALLLRAAEYKSYDYDEIKANFTNKNVEFFKAVYFDFAPIWAIPVYQESPVHSLDPLPDYAQLYANKECEVLSNAMNEKYIVHPDTKTDAILKPAFVRTANGIDEVSVTAYSYDIEQRVDVVSVYGGDGHFHNVNVPWDEYLPLENSKHFFVTKAEQAEQKLASRNGLCIYN